MILREEEGVELMMIVVLLGVVEEDRVMRPSPWTSMLPYKSKAPAS